MDLNKKILFAIFILFSFTFSSCINDDNIEFLILKVNHFKQSGTGSYSSLFLLTQEGYDANSWSMFYDDIEGFKYELGYVYTLKVEKSIIENPHADGSSYGYRLVEVQAKNETPVDTTFEILLLRKYDNSNVEPFVTGDLQTGFMLLDQTSIDCEGLCDDLIEKLKLNEELTGVFQHASGNIVKLIELK